MFGLVMDMHPDLPGSGAVLAAIPGQSREEKTVIELWAIRAEGRCASTSSNGNNMEKPSEAQVEMSSRIAMFTFRSIISVLGALPLSVQVRSFSADSMGTC